MIYENYLNTFIDQGQKDNIHTVHKIIIKLKESSSYRLKSHCKINLTKEYFVKWVK